jgi:hypothetical protein
VIITSHHPLGAGSGRPTHMAWNYREVTHLLSQHRCVMDGGLVTPGVFAAGRQLCSMAYASVLAPPPPLDEAMEV